MRKLNSVAVAAATGLAFYFTLFWGADALHMIASSTWGLDEAERAQFLFIIGAMLKLTPIGLIKLAAFFAVVKLAIASICGLHILDRAGALVTGKTTIGLIHVSLALIVVVSIIVIGSEVWAQNVEFARDYVLQLVLAGLAGGICLVEWYTRGNHSSEFSLYDNAALERATGREA